MTFHTRRVDGHVRVVPRDAEALIRAGRLDARLFDVTTLTEYGYADAERDDLPLLLTYANGIRARSAADGVRVTRQLPAIDGAAGWSTRTRPPRSGTGSPDRPEPAPPAESRSGSGWTAGAGSPWTAACRRSAHRPPGRPG